MVFTGPLIRVTWYLQAPLFDLHGIYRPPYSSYIVFTGPLIRFACYLQAPIFDLHVMYRPPYSIYMVFTGSLIHLQAPLFELL